MSDNSYILFHSSNHAMWASDTLKRSAIPSKIVPVPRELSSDCGYCIRISSNNSADAIKLLENEKIEYDRIEQI